MGIMGIDIDPFNTPDPNDIFDPGDMKLKHVSGICFQLANEPAEDTVLFLYHKRNRKQMTIEEIASAFSCEDALENTKKSVNALVRGGYLKEEDGKYKQI